MSLSGTTLPSDVHEQRDYTAFLLREAVQKQAQFVTWFVPIDYDRLWDKVGDPQKEWARAWQDTGMVDEKLSPRPALKVWDSYLFGVGDTNWVLNFEPLFQRWESHGGQPSAALALVRPGLDFVRYACHNIHKTGHHHLAAGPSPAHKNAAVRRPLVDQVPRAAAKQITRKFKKYKQ